MACLTCSSSTWRHGFQQFGCFQNPPKSSILIGFSIINPPFWGFSPFFWKHPYIYIYINCSIYYLKISGLQYPKWKLRFNGCFKKTYIRSRVPKFLTYNLDEFYPQNFQAYSWYYLVTCLPFPPGRAGGFNYLQVHWVKRCQRPTILH